MFTIIYQFQVKKNNASEFMDAWKQLTQLIYKYEGSLGSRLHKQNDNSFIAYAQWPNKKKWQNSGNKLPEYTQEVRTKMRKYCTKIEILHELECIEDLLKPEPYQKDT